MCGLDHRGKKVFKYFVLFGISGSNIVSNSLDGGGFDFKILMYKSLIEKSIDIGGVFGKHFWGIGEEISHDLESSFNKFIFGA